MPQEQDSFAFQEEVSIGAVQIPPDFQPLYQESAEAPGTFRLKDEYKSVATAVQGIRSALAASRAEAKDLNKQKVDLSALKEFGSTPDEIKQNFAAKMQELQNQALGKNEDAKLNLDKIREELATSHAAEMQKATGKIQELTNHLHSYLVESETVSAVTELGGVPELLAPVVKQQVKVVEEDGKYNVYVVDSVGDRRYSGATGQPMTIKELVAEMKNDKRFSRVFESNFKQGGGGMLPGSGQKPPAGANLTSAQKIALGLRNRG